MSSSTSRSCCINLSKDLASEDHAFFVKLLLGAGVRSADIRVIDIQGRRGTCKVTLASTAARDTLLSRGLSAQGKTLELLPGDGTAETVHVFGVPEDMALSAIASSLSRFGTLLGPVKNEKKTVEGCTFSTGIVYYTMVPTIAVPSSITVGRYKLRVWHKGQTPTCWKCSTPGHVARDCRAISRQGTKPSPGAATSTSELGPPQEPLGQGQENQEVAALPTPAKQQQEGSVNKEAQDHVPDAPQPWTYANALGVHTPCTSARTEATAPTSSSTPAFPMSRGKAGHPSPDDQGFKLARGKHTFPARVITPATKQGVQVTESEESKAIRQLVTRLRMSMPQRKLGSRRRDSL